MNYSNRGQSIFVQCPRKIFTIFRQFVSNNKARNLTINAKVIYIYKEPLITHLFEKRTKQTIALLIRAHSTK